MQYKKPPIGDFYSWRSGWDSRRHWGSVAASPGNSKSIHRMLFAPLGDVPFESLRSFFVIQKAADWRLLFLAERVGFPAPLGQCRRQPGELEKHSQDAFRPSRGRSLRIPPLLFCNTKSRRLATFILGGAGGIPGATGAVSPPARGTRKAFTGCFSPLSGTFPSNPSAPFL